MSPFKKLTPEEIEIAFSLQHENHGWTFYNEREHIENLFCQRFNFLLVVYSLFITAAATVDNQLGRISIFLTGFIFIVGLSLTLYRVYVKLIILLQILHSLKGHVFSTIEMEIQALGNKALFGVNQLIGIYIPIFCILTFLIGLVYNIYIYATSCHC